MRFLFSSKSSASNDYYIVDLQRTHINSSFGFSIRGGREFSIPLFILKVAENGPAAFDSQMTVNVFFSLIIVLFYFN